MANFQNLLDSIASVIHQNGNQEITGEVLKSTLQSMVSVLGANATFGGIAHISDKPGTPDGPVVYIASDVGTYPNFGALEILTDELAVFVWNPTAGTWSKESITYIADKSEIEDLIQQGIEEIGIAKQEALDEIEEFAQVDMVYDVEGEISTGEYDIQLKKRNGELLFPNGQISTGDESLYDATIEDESGNAIAYLHDGEVTTKKFSSESSVVTDNLYECNDIVFSDDKGNDVGRIVGGNIVLKNFDSTWADHGRIKMYLPKVINTYIGDNLQLFKYPVTLLGDYKNWGVNFGVISSDKNVKKQGKTLSRYFQFAPILTGTYQINANLIDRYNRMHDQKSMTINVITPTSPSSMKNILFIGDSEVEGIVNNSGISVADGASDEGIFSFVNEVKRLLTGTDSATVGMPASLGLTNIQMIGTKNTTGGRHEGYGGKDVSWFYGSSSPFYKSGAINFNTYLGQDSVYADTAHKGVDLIYILLGANEDGVLMSENERYYLRKPTYVSEMKQLLDKIIAQLITNTSATYYNPNLKIILLNYAWSYIDGYGYHPYGSSPYSDGNWTARLFRGIYEMNEQIASDPTYSPYVESVMIAPHVDSENGYAYIMKEKNNYMTETELQHIEAVHPSTIGYRMYGAGVVRDIIGRI